jgi:hypothetical protein
MWCLSLDMIAKLSREADCLSPKSDTEWRVITIFNDIDVFFIGIINFPTFYPYVTMVDSSTVTR